MPMSQTQAAVDTERFRLRRFVEKLVQLGECEIHDKPIDMVDVASVLDGNTRATLFKSAGPDKQELVGNVMGSRKRLAMALDTDEKGLLPTLGERLQQPIPPVKVKDAPVQEVVLTGADADLTALPVHLQHGEDGAPYISASVDFAIDPATGWTNVGIRRLMLRGRQEAGVDLNSPSDLRAIYEASAAKGRPLPISFVVGAHPVDHVAAVMRLPLDELSLIATLRDAPLPV